MILFIAPVIFLLVASGFIIDKEGRIIQKNLRGPQLAAKISELLSD